MNWRKVKPEQRDELLRRRVAGEDIVDLADSIGMKPLTLDRRLREWRQYKSDKRREDEPSKLYKLLQDGPASLKDLSTQLDRSEATIIGYLQELENRGYVIERYDGGVSTGSIRLAEGVPQLDALIQEPAHEFTFAVASDIHTGSNCSQPTHLNTFINKAYHTYDVRHVMIPGDLFAGLYGYRGQEYDLIPHCSPRSHKEAYIATQAQIQLADFYLPHYDGLTYYLLGGNHDYWHVTKVGMDAISVFARGRDDVIYLGYDMADVPLTDGISLRLWHPSGGVPYALSYRVQKSLELLAFENLTQLLSNDLPRPIRFLLAGHLHIEVKLQRGPFIASQVGCFEGRTNYEKRKGMMPEIGGQIWRVELDEDNRISLTDYIFMPFPEIINDWMNWPVPIQMDVIDEPDFVETLFGIKNDDVPF